MSAKSGKVGELVGEITSASNEQAQGIEQINVAMTQMDKVVQSTAANAEESAGAATELEAQTQTMRNVVDNLTSLITGSKSNAGPTNHTRIRSNDFESNTADSEPVSSGRFIAFDEYGDDAEG